MDNDKKTVEAQLDRSVRSDINVTTKCTLLPVVIKVPPNLDDGTPFPTSIG